MKTLVIIPLLIVCASCSESPEEAYAKYKAAKLECELFAAKMESKSRKTVSQNRQNYLFFEKECIKRNKGEGACATYAAKLYPPENDYIEERQEALLAENVCMKSRGFK